MSFKNIKNATALFVAMCALSSCVLFYEKPPKGWPAIEARPLVGISGFPSTDTVYGTAFRDGCMSAWDAVTRGLASDLVAKGIDSKIAATDVDYRSGWWDGFEQCTYIVDWDVV